MNIAVERAAGFIWEHYSEPLTLTDIAGSAALSRFHLSRIFRAATGVAPCRFLSAVRVYQAKHLLATTGVGVADISFAVGYNSVGSFTSYFTGSVGVSPTVFRQKAQLGDFEFPGLAPDRPSDGGTVQGTITLPGDYAGARVYLGAFDTPFVQHRPVGAVVLDIPPDGRAREYCLHGVPKGKWFIRAVGTAGPDGTALVGGRGPVPVAARTGTEVPVVLRPRRTTDPPVLLALPGHPMTHALPHDLPHVLTHVLTHQASAPGRVSCARS